MKHMASIQPMRGDPPIDEVPLLVEQLRAGSMAALSTAYDRYAAVVFTAALRLLGVEADAEDVTHDVFVSLPRLVRSFEGRGSFEGWLRTIAIRSAALRLRKERRWGSISHLLQQITPAPAREPAADIDLDRALARLTPGLRAVFVLHEIEGRPHDEIATLLGITRSASLVRLHRAKRQLITLLRLEHLDR